MFGNCEPKFLESLKVTGLDCGLKMLPPLRMPIKVATLHGIIREQKLGAPVVKGGGISLKDAPARQAVTFLYQPKSISRQASSPAPKSWPASPTRNSVSLHPINSSRAPSKKRSRI